MNANAWIKSPKYVGDASVCFVKTFDAAPDVTSGTLCVSAIGLFEAKLNGQKLGRGVLTPGYTDYDHRVQYMTYDLAGLLERRNTLEITAAPGWAAGRYGHTCDADHQWIYSDHYAVNAELTLLHDGGGREVIVTDETWQTFTSKILFSSLYDGETLDLTAKMDKLGYAAADPASARFPLIPQQGADVTEHERVAPVAFFVTPKGERVVDFGQNIAGYVEFDIEANRGDRIVISHAEVLDRDGNFYTGNYRTAKNKVTYVLSGDRDVVKPTFSFQGFRYIRLDEYPFDKVNLDGMRAVAIYSDMKRTGRFVSGNDKINQLYHNTLWGQRGNYVDIPTDCPQRDERMGWLGDAQVFCRTAALQYDVRAFFYKWLGDVRADQLENGGLHGTCPCRFAGPYRSRISAAWGDAATIIPMELYRAYGDKTILRDNFEMMKRWVGYMRSEGPEEYLWLGGFHYGDWLAMDAGADSYVGATSNDLIASAFYAYSTELVVKAGHILGEDVSQYEQLYVNVRRAFRDYFMKDGLPKKEFPLTEQTWPGHAVSDTVRQGVTQTALVLILQFGLCESEERPGLAQKLVELINDSDGLMATGFVGTPYILHVLTAAGYSDVAYHLLFEERNPSWLYSVNHGATTMWEHWNGIKEDGSFWSDKMNSFNHYAYGAVVDWLFGGAAGIEVTKAGYRAVRFCPHPDRRLGFVNASVETDRGTVGSNWYYRGDTICFEFAVPKDCEAEIVLPNGYIEAVPGGTTYCYQIKA